MPQLLKPNELSDSYYLDNFNCLIDFVFAHYETLLCDEEKHFYAQFTKLPENAQRLFIRLLSRNGDYARTTKLNYSEIPDLKKALEKLTASGFITPAHIDQIADWQSLFTRKELSGTLALPSSQIASLNPQAVATLLTTSDLFGTSPLDSLLESEHIVQINFQECYTIFRLLFFGNLHQDLSTFVLRDLGVRKFESYLTDTDNLPFQCRKQIDAHLLYYRCVDGYEFAEDTGAASLIELHAQLPEKSKSDTTLNRKIDRFTNRIARQLERENHLQDAVRIYRSNIQPPARERIARIEATIGNESAAFELCQQIEKNPADAEEKEFSQEFAARLAKRVGIDYYRPEKNKPAEIQLELPNSNLPVEFIAALHFAKSGKCFYVENSLVTGIFGLAIWDIIFAPIPGAFYHPFQSAPADFYESDFYHARESLFKQRFIDFKKGCLSKVVLTHFHNKSGIRNPLVQWPYLNRYLITLALKKIPLTDWLKLFEYLLKDIRHHRSGLPDLINFPDTGRYSLLEVKGPGDRLQKNQLRWMQFFKDSNIDHAVVNVAYLDEATSRDSETETLLTEHSIHFE